MEELNLNEQLILLQAQLSWEILNKEWPEARVTLKEIEKTINLIVYKDKGSVLL